MSLRNIVYCFVPTPQSCDGDLNVAHGQPTMARCPHDVSEVPIRQRCAMNRSVAATSLQYRCTEIVEPHNDKPGQLCITTLPRRQHHYPLHAFCVSRAFPVFCFQSSNMYSALSSNFDSAYSVEDMSEDCPLLGRQLTVLEKLSIRSISISHFSFIIPSHKSCTYTTCT